MRYLCYIPALVVTLLARQTPSPLCIDSTERPTGRRCQPRAHLKSKASQGESRLGNAAMADSLRLRYPAPSLPTQGSTIRLLRIDHKIKSSIVGKLEQFSLDSPRCPKFTTISYVWGKYQPEERVNITVNGTRFLVASSVPPILELLRDHPDFKKSPWIWIDGICVNQSDDMEKNAQVNMMGRIFKRSEMTLIWLGKAEQDTDAAMDLLQDLTHRKKGLRRNYLSKGIRRTPSDIHHPDKWKSLRRFFSLPWWKRVWTLQEFILARDVKFYWGNRSIDRKDLNGALQAIWHCNPGNHLIQETT